MKNVCDQNLHHCYHFINFHGTTEKIGQDLFPPVLSWNDYLQSPLSFLETPLTSTPHWPLLAGRGTTCSPLHFPPFFTTQFSPPGPLNSQQWTVNSEDFLLDGALLDLHGLIRGSPADTTEYVSHSLLATKHTSSQQNKVGKPLVANRGVF